MIRYFEIKQKALLFISAKKIPGKERKIYLCNSRMTITQMQKLVFRKTINPESLKIKNRHFTVAASHSNF